MTDQLIRTTSFQELRAAVKAARRAFGASPLTKSRASWTAEQAALAPAFLGTVMALTEALDPEDAAVEIGTLVLLRLQLTDGVTAATPDDLDALRRALWVVRAAFIEATMDYSQLLAQHAAATLPNRSRTRSAYLTAHATLTAIAPHYRATVAGLIEALGTGPDTQDERSALSIEWRHIRRTMVNLSPKP